MTEQAKLASRLEAIVDAGLILSSEDYNAIEQAAKILRGLEASERPALAVGEPVGRVFCVIGNGSYPLVEWNQPVQVGTSLYAAPPAAEAVAGQSGALSSLQEPMPVDPDVTPENPETPGTWQERCAALYQVIGTLSDQFGIFETSDDVGAALDVAAGRGDVSALLPWPKDATHGKAFDPQQGWVSVPREPTEAMIEAGDSVYNSADAIANIYRAMLSASPPAAQPASSLTGIRALRDAAFRHSMAATSELASMEAKIVRQEEAIEAAQSGEGGGK